ncbi:hypothetical protein Goshw_019660 [Gossypium schwendimanii]|uniref:Uncharacterized protein n=1 Tax=Gossypium schwendimanii TaxID=34291 RepID=A0A7J9LPG8_GOSSC|nr:hypothetical protein [Gossypium schwendimanii]
MKFNVVGVAVEEVAGCGGVLRDEKGAVKALFLVNVLLVEWSKW